MVACGGSSNPSVAKEESGPPPAAAVAEPTATPDPLFDLTQITPIPPPEPQTATDRLLGGAPDRRAARAITDALNGEGFDLTGVELYVFPLPSGNGNMLVLNWEVFGGAELVAEPVEVWLNSLLEAEAFRDAHISRLVINWLISDERGEPAAVFILTLPSDAMAAASSGAITREEMLQKSRLEIRVVQAE